MLHLPMLGRMKRRFLSDVRGPKLSRFERPAFVTVAEIAPPCYIYVHHGRRVGARWATDGSKHKIKRAEL
jgi:hypothetical protein